MPMLTDLIAASPDDASAILVTQGHANVWSTLELPAITPAQWASLRFVLMRQPAEVRALADYLKGFERLGASPDSVEGDPWLVALPEDLGLLMAQMSLEEIAEHASNWQALETSRGQPVQALDLEALLAELAAFAASALAQGQRLLLWICP